MSIELNTPDKLEYQFQPVNGGVFSFKVRAPNDAHIALTSSPVEENPMYEVFLGGWGNTKSVIRKDRQKPDVVEQATPDILSANEYRGFWIRWYDNSITVGREGEAGAFMFYDADHSLSINYVGICTGWGAQGSWIIDNSSKGNTSECGTECWVPGTGGEVPPSALEGGVDGGEQLYVARTRHEGDLIPGKLHPSHGVCYIAYGGGEHGHSDYEVLCSAGGHWMPVVDGNIPPNAFPGGETADGEPLFIGRALHDGTMCLGKVQPSHECCYIPYGGEELAYKEYEIYVKNS